MIKRAACGIVLVALSACYSGPGTSSRGDAALAVTTPAPAGGGLPAGIVTPKPIAGYYEGIYRPQGTEPCCWLSDHATFQVRLPANAKAIQVRVFLPPLPLYADRPERLSVRLEGEPSVTFGPLSAGEHVLTYHIKPHKSPAVERLDLRPAYSFVPAREHINGDTRMLSMYLRSVTPQ